LEFERFLLDEWLDSARGAGRLWNLGSVAGPAWTLGELLELGDDADRAAVMATSIDYSKAAGADDLRVAIAKRNDVDPEEVLILTGASEALLIVFFAAAQTGVNVVLPDPAFPPTAAIPRALGIEVRSYHLRRENGYAIDLDEVAALVDARTRILLINSPHNPTGAVIPDETKRELARIASANGASLVSDEVFHPIYHRASDVRSAASGADIRATVIGDMSKAFSLPGLRLGWLIERDPSLRAQYLRARMNFTITPNPISERLAAMALGASDLVLDRTCSLAASNLAQLRDFMARWPWLLEWVEPAGGTCAFPWLRSGRSSRGLCEALLEAGVLVVPGDAFGRPEHIRIGFAREPDLDEALEAAGRVLQGLRPRHSHA
jgi:aspartate/methionine/tyrosine aminotransferase